MNFTTIGNFLVVDIYEPMSETNEYEFVGVDKRNFDYAKRNAKWLLVRSPKGERQIMPKGYKIRKKDIMEKVFLFPNSPMKLVKICVPKCEKKPNEYYQFTH